MGEKKRKNNLAYDKMKEKERLVAYTNQLNDNARRLEEMLQQRNTQQGAVGRRLLNQISRMQAEHPETEAEMRRQRIGLSKLGAEAEREAKLLAIMEKQDKARTLHKRIKQEKQAELYQRHHRERN